MDVALVPGPGNGRELEASLARNPDARVRLIRRAEELQGADLILTPRGPSRSFSRWYREDPLGQAVVQAYLDGTPWVALCGSSLPLASKLGRGCDGIEPLSLLAMAGTNDLLNGQGNIETREGVRLPFHFTSAPAYEPQGSTEVLGKTGGQGSVLRDGDLVVCSGLPLSREAWAFLFGAAGYPVAGAEP